MSRIAPTRPRPAARRPLRIAAALLVVLASARCATASGDRAPLPDPDGTAAGAAEAGPDRAHRITVGWEYADERGPVRGDGVLRFNPPDSLRLDLLSAGGAAMRVALVEDDLRTDGQIEDVRLPPPAFLYATAGLFRPGLAGPEAGWTEDGTRILAYATPGGGTLVYRLREGRIVRLEERDGGRELRRLELAWPDPAGTWPRRAEYRDRTRDSRARWTVAEVQLEEPPFPSEIYELPDVP